jgi:hypothetical protein
MRTHCNTLGALAAVSALVAGNAMAEVEYELHTGYSNEYLFRGLNLGQDLIEVGADVKAEVSGVGLSAGVWYGSFDNADLGAVSNLTLGELDLYGQVSKDFGWLTGAVGYIYRYYDANEDASLGTQEVYFSVSRQFCGIDTSLTYFWGIEEDNDGYAEFALGRSFELSPCLSFNCGTKLGYLAEQGQLTAVTSKLSLDWGFTTTATLSPFVAWSLALSDDTDTAYWNSKNQVVGGMMLSVAF